MPVDHRLTAPAAERNKGPILDVLQRVLPARGTVLEVASGTGQHVVWFASALPALRWIPSDPDPRHRASIAAHVGHAGLGNVLPPLNLDVLGAWEVEPVDALIVANLLHVAPPDALPALCRGAASVLAPAGVLHVYGPFKRDGRPTTAGNARFDASLRATSPQWGLRDLEDLAETAGRHGLALNEIIDMPADNFSLVFEKGT